MISPEELLTSSHLEFSIPRTLEINDGSITLGADDFSAIVQQWSGYFKENTQYHSGVVVNFEHWTVQALAIYLALTLSGIPYYALNTATIKESNLRALYDQGVTELIYMPRPYNEYDYNLLEMYWAIGFNTDHLEVLDISDSVSPSSSTWTLDLDSRNFYCFTSGTTGEPKLISHTNRSVFWSATRAQELFYNLHDRVLLTSLPNHIGVMTMAVLAPILAGSHIVLANLCDPDVIAKYNYCNKTLLFYYQILNPQLDSVDFSKYKLAITGGEAIRQHYLDLVFNRGIKRVASVYGLTEAMPPVATMVFDKPILDYDLGTFTQGIEHKVVDDVLYLKGPNSYVYPEWLRTGDLVEQREDKVYFKTRAVNSVRRGGELIDIDRLKECCELWGLRNFLLRSVEPDRIEAHGELETQVVLLSSQAVDLHSLNKHVVEQLGENYRISWSELADIERNDIFKATNV